MFKSNKNLVFILYSLFTIFFLTTMTVAWLTETMVLENHLAITDFSIEKKICFISGGTPENEVTITDVMQNIDAEPVGGVTVNLTNKSAPNYIGNLRVAVKVNSVSPVYIRVRILESWSEDDEFIPSGFTPYTIGTSEDILFAEGDKIVASKLVKTLSGEWFDNRTQDFCFYYTVPVYPESADLSAPLENDIWMLLINGISDENLLKINNARPGVDLSMLISVDVVQPNRYREFWKIDALPFPLP